MFLPFSNFLTNENLYAIVFFFLFYYFFFFFFFFPGKKKKEASGSDDDSSNAAAARVEVDDDNFKKVVARPKGKKHGSFGRKIQDDEPSYTGRMRAFPDDPVVPSDDQESDANGGPNVGNAAPEKEGQLFDQW